MEEMSPNEKKSTIHGKAKINIGLVALEGGFQEEKEINSDNFIRYGDKIAIRVCDGRFRQTDINNGAIIVAKERHIKEWEIFKLVLASDPFVSEKGRIVRYGDKVAFQALINRSFVGADHNHRSELTSRVHWVKEWETFIVVRPTDTNKPREKKLRFGGWLALQSSNGKFVMYDRDESRKLCARADLIKEWECFVLINPEEP
jgi:hypothetical protein